MPVELKWLFEHEVEPYLRKKFTLAEVIHYRVLKIVGVGESAVDDKIGHLIAGSTNPTVGVLAHPGQVDVRIAAKAADKEESMKLIAPLEAEVRSLMGNAVFAVDDETMEHVVGRLLQAKGKTVAVYEDLSCGQLAERLQKASSEYFAAGFIGNTVFAARALLNYGREPAGVEQLLQEPVSLTDELAWSVRRLAGSDIGLALHAIADPTSDVQNLARGQAYMSVTDGNKFIRAASMMAGRGAYDRMRMTLGAIDLLRTALIGSMP